MRDVYDYVAFITTRLPLTIPLFDSRHVYFEPTKPKKRYLVRRGFATLTANAGIFTDFATIWHAFSTTQKEAEFAIEDSEDAAVALSGLFLREFCSDTDSFIVPLKKIYDLACQQTIPAVFWLFKIPSFSNHPLSERHLVSLIHAF